MNILYLKNLIPETTGVFWPQWYQYAECDTFFFKCSSTPLTAVSICGDDISHSNKERLSGAQGKLAVSSNCKLYQIETWYNTL